MCECKNIKCQNDRTSKYPNVEMMKCQNIEILNINMSNGWSVERSKSRNIYNFAAIVHSVHLFSSRIHSLNLLEVWIELFLKHFMHFWADRIFDLTHWTDLDTDSLIDRQIDTLLSVGKNRLGGGKPPSTTLNPSNSRKNLPTVWGTQSKSRRNLQIFRLDRIRRTIVTIRILRIIRMIMMNEIISIIIIMKIRLTNLRWMTLRPDQPILVYHLLRDYSFGWKSIIP